MPKNGILSASIGLLSLPVAVCLTVSLVAGSGQVNFRVIASMNGGLQQPNGITEGAPGIFYSVGGPSGQTAFSVATGSAKTILASFPTSHNILAPLVTASNQRFYSTVGYMLNPPNGFSVSSTANSKQTYAPQNVGFMVTENLPDGNLLGIAGTISAYSSYFVAKSDLEGNVATVYSFPAGETLPHTLIYANDGNYYGLSIGSDGSGYTYRVTPAGALTKLWNFPSGTFDGATYLPLLQADDGNLYGIATGVTGSGRATFYRLTLDGQYTLLYTFPHGGYNYEPTTLIEGSDGNFYGSTLGVGSKLFRLTKSGAYTELYTMNAIRDGQCLCQLTLGSDGIIYGTAQGQGKYGGGDIFALDLGMPIPRPWAQKFGPETGPARHSRANLGSQPAFGDGVVQRRAGRGCVEQRSELCMGHCSGRHHHRPDHRHDAGRQQQHASALHGAITVDRRAR